MVQESPQRESLESPEETRRVLKRRKSFLTEEEAAAEVEAQEAGDLHEGERVFLITRRQLVQQYKFEKQRQLVHLTYV